MDKKFAPGFQLTVDGLLNTYDPTASTPAEALVNLLNSKDGYLVIPGTKVRVFRLVDEGGSAVTAHVHGEREEQESIITNREVIRRIYSSSLEVTLNFVFDWLPGEELPLYDDLLKEVQSVCRRVRSIDFLRVAMSSDVHYCTRECPYFGKPDHVVDEKVP